MKGPKHTQIPTRFSPETRLVLGWLLSLLLVVAGLFSGYQAIRSYNQASVTVEWSTASELDTVGFNILRAEQPGGPYRQINTSLIPASDNPYSGGDYSYQDHEAVSGQVYYYLLQDIESTGAINEYGPIEIQAKNNNLLLLLLAGILFVSAAVFSRQVWSDQRAFRAADQ